MLKRLRIHTTLLTGALLTLSVGACAMSSQQGAEPAGKSMAIRLADINDLDGIIPELAKMRVVFIGEVHGRYEHHLNQLVVIKGIHQRHPKMAIGLEFFQWPYQAVLDRFVAGEIDEAQMLRETEYFSRWRFDYRMYKPILDYARDNRIPLLALNVPTELTQKVAAGGLDALSNEERNSLPADIDRDDKAYRARVEAVYNIHPQRPGSTFENFLDAQLCWDEGMAERAAEFLQSHPDHKMVVLSGTGHVIEGTGIPNRLARRMAVSTAIVINGGDLGLDTAMGDYLLLPEPQTLPALGMLGVYLDPREEGLYVDGLEEDGAAAKAGIQVKDILLSINGQALTSYDDLRITMLNMLAGDKVTVTVRRSDWLLGQEEVTLEATLH